MATYDPAKLLGRLLNEDGEREWLEYKVNNSNVQLIGEYVSALANSAMLANRDRAFLVFGIEDKSKRRIGTTIKLHELKKGAENFPNWISRLLEPKIILEFLDFEVDGLNFSIITIEPSYDRPVAFSGAEYIRIGENKRKLKEFPHHERSLWLATGRRKFEHAIAMPNQSEDEVLVLLDVAAFYNLSDEPMPNNGAEIMRRFLSVGFLADNMEGYYDITNLGAILLAKELSNFPSIAGKSVRIVRYEGTDKQRSNLEQEGIRGYAVGFSTMIRFIMRRIPHERGISGRRSTHCLSLPGDVHSRGDRECTYPPGFYNSW